MDIGTGHVMRCLTLAGALREQGSTCKFLCRGHKGNLLGYIRERGFEAIELPQCHAPTADDTDKLFPEHSGWLGTDWMTDASQSQTAMGDAPVDWLIVDHYALDVDWEKALQACCRNLMVIDDLADRPHVCDVLLDQNLGREIEDYIGLVPEHCKILTGPNYALLRSEFAELRDYSLKRRANPQLKRLLISMGGVDQLNATGRVLEALKCCTLPDECRITVIMGSTAPWLPQVLELAAQMPWPTEVLVNVSDMAQRMADSDLSIGAAGSTSWERCCLGLPTLLAVLAENQLLGARALQDEKAAIVVGVIDDIENKLQSAIQQIIQGDFLGNMSVAASRVTSGRGVENVLQSLGVEMSEKTSKKISIRPMLHADLLQVLAWRNDPEVRRCMYTQHEITLDEHQRWFDRCSEDPRKHLLIFELDYEPFGFVNFSEMTEGGIADWGFYTAPDAPRGSGRKLGTAAIGHAFIQLKLHKVCGQALLFNDKSIRLHEFLKFQREGTLRDQHFDGENYHDVVCFGLLATEWRQSN